MLGVALRHDCTSGRHSVMVSGRARTRGLLAALAGLTVAVLALVWPFAAGAVLPAQGPGVDAPGLTAGPLVTDAGLVWQNSTAIELTDAAGDSRQLSAGVGRPGTDAFHDAWFGLQYWVVARPSGVFAGPIGGALRKPALLQRCNPTARGAPPGVSAALYALSGEQLFAALPARCFARRSTPLPTVVDLNLRTRRWHVLAQIPGELGYLAASGNYVPLAYWRTPSRRSGANRTGSPASPLFVRVFNALTGALVNQVVPPSSDSSTGFRSNVAAGLQVDQYGDVLVHETVGCCTAKTAQPPPLPQWWWWAKPRAAVGHLVALGNDAELSGGRVAFFSSDPSDGAETIDVADLRAGVTRAIVTFPGTASASSLGFSGNGLAWAQQSTVVNVTKTPDTYSCTRVALGPLQLVSVDLRSVPSSPLVEDGAPIPPQYAHEPMCVEA